MLLGKLVILAALCLLAIVVHGCKEGELIKVLENCEEYDECIDGNLMRKKCKLGEYFDGEKCDKFWNVKCIKKPCIEGLIYERGTCTIDYDICQDGKLRREICPAMYRFNGKSCVPLEICKDATINIQLIDSYVSETKKCIEGDRIPQDEYSYLECINGLLVMKPCKLGMAFNKFTKTCHTVSINLNIKEFCEEADRKPLPDCSKYQLCVKGQYTEKQCPDNMLFDKNYLMCRFAWQATCSDGSCKDGVLIPDLNDCSYYYTCDKGNKSRQECGFLKSFNPVEQTCSFTKHCERDPCTGDWTKVSQDCKEYTVCKNDYQITYSCPALQKYVDGKCQFFAQCAQPNALLVNKTKCVEGETNRVFGRCTEYMKCISGEWKTMKCPEGTNFQEDACEKKVCPLLPVLNHCNEFMLPGKTNIYACPVGYLFDTIDRQCVPKAVVRCAKGECVPGDKINHPTDCGKYKLCKDGKWEIETCSIFFPHFDITLKECRYWHYNCSYDHADCTTGKLRPDPSDCKAYEKCEANSWRANRCWFWQHFDSKTNSCATFSYKCAEKHKLDKVEIVHPKQLKQIKGMNKKQELASKCIEGETNPIPNTCRWYTECVNGEELRKKCSPCQNYNVEEKKCAWVWKKPCKPDVTDPPLTPTTGSTPEPTISTPEPTISPPEPTISTPEPTISPPEPTISTPEPTISPPEPTISTPEPATLKPECNKENEKRGVKSDCHLYEVCKGGKWIQEKCSVWGKFDKTTKECIYFQMWKVKCEQ